MYQKEIDKKNMLKKMELKLLEENIEDIFKKDLNKNLDNFKKFLAGEAFQELKDKYAIDIFEDDSNKENCKAYKVRFKDKNLITEFKFTLNE